MVHNEAELAQRASQRDPDAFAATLHAYVEKIYKYVYYKVGDPCEAEDLCEQVFLKAWEAIGRYTWYGYPFSSWLYRLAHNLVVDHYRTRREILPLNDTLLIREEPIDPEVALARSLGFRRTAPGHPAPDAGAAPGDLPEVHRGLQQQRNRQDDAEERGRDPRPAISRPAQPASHPGSRRSADRAWVPLPLGASAAPAVA